MATGVFKGIYNNCKFEAKLDENSNFHILDSSGDEPYKSVTNAVDELIPYLMNQYCINPPTVFAFLYGTDSVISCYDYRNRLFTYTAKATLGEISKLDDFIKKGIDVDFCVKMVSMYNGL